MATRKTPGKPCAGCGEKDSQAARIEELGRLLAIEHADNARNRAELEKARTEVLDLRTAFGLHSDVDGIPEEVSQKVSPADPPRARSPHVAPVVEHRPVQPAGRAVLRADGRMLHDEVEDGVGRFGGSSRVIQRPRKGGSRPWEPVDQRRPASGERD